MFMQRLAVAAFKQSSSKFVLPNTEVFNKAKLMISNASNCILPPLSPSFVIDDGCIN